MQQLLLFPLIFRILSPSSASPSCHPLRVSTSGIYIPKATISEEKTDLIPAEACPTIHDESPILIDLVSNFSRRILGTWLPEDQAYTALLPTSGQRLLSADVPEGVFISQFYANGNKEDLSSQVEVENYILKAGDVKKAFRSAAIEGYKEAVFSLLENDQIDKENINEALEMASFKGHKDIVLHLLQDDRIETCSIKTAFHTANQNRHQEIVFLLLKDPRLDADSVKTALNWGLIKGHNEIAFHLLEDQRIQVADVKEAFLLACKTGFMDAVLHFLKDDRIETADLKRVFSSSLRTNSNNIYSALLNDKRIDSEDLKHILKIAPSWGLVSLVIEDRRIESSSIKLVFRWAVQYGRRDIFWSLIEDKRLDAEDINHAFLSACKEYCKSGEFPWREFILRLLKRTEGGVLMKKELANVVESQPISINQMNFLIENKLLDMLDLSFSGIYKLAQSSKELFYRYCDELWQILLRARPGFCRPNLVPKWIARIPVLSLHVFNAIQMQIENTKFFVQRQVVQLIERLDLLHQKLSTLDNIPHLNLARECLLLVPKSLFSPLKQIFPDGSRGYNYIQKAETANKNREEYLNVFKQFLINSVKDDNALRKFLQFHHMGPGKSSKEIELVRTMIVKDLCNVDNPKDLITNIYNHTDYIIVADWIKQSWKSGNRELIDLVVKTLADHWECKEFVDELITQIAKSSDIVGLKLYVVDSNVDKVVKILKKRPENTGLYFFEIENVSFDKIHELPLDDNTFFAPSFRLIVGENESAFDSHFFHVRYLKERGMDQSGLSRNWIKKMLHAMADPKRHFLKTHGVKNELVPDIGVDPKVFFGLGRLIGRGILKNARLPFAFHPKWIQIIKDPQDKVLIKSCFEEFYAEELGMIDGLLSYIEIGDFKKDSSIEFIPPSKWHLTSEKGIRNFLNIHLQESPSKPGQDILSFFKMPANVHETNQTEHGPTFQLKTAQDLKQFVEMARNQAYSVFNDNITSFMKGLGHFIKTDLISWVPTPIMLSIFSPSPEIDVDALSS